MGGRVFDLAALIVGGVILADLIKNYTGTKTLIDGVQGLWGQSLNGLLGQTS